MGNIDKTNHNPSELESDKDLLYPICQTVSDKLSWSHICELSCDDWLPALLTKNKTEIR